MPWTPIPPPGDLIKVEVALWHLRAALDDKNDPPIRRDSELTGQLMVDAGVLLSGNPYQPIKTTYYRPWETAARLIEQGGDYEVAGELRSVTDRKIASLRRTQQTTDARDGAVPLLGPDGTPVDLTQPRITWGDR